MSFDQWWILAFNAAYFWLNARTDAWQKWSYALGLAAQPAFLYATWKAEQWGMFILTLFIIWQLVVGHLRRRADAH